MKVTITADTLAKETEKAFEKYKRLEKVTTNIPLAMTYAIEDHIKEAWRNEYPAEKEVYVFNGQTATLDLFFNCRSITKLVSNREWNAETISMVMTSLLHELELDCEPMQLGHSITQIANFNIK